MLPYQVSSSHQPLQGLIIAIDYTYLSWVYCSQVQYQQLPRYVHPHEVPVQGQYIPSYGHPNTLQQSHEKPAIQGQTHFIAQVIYTVAAKKCCQFHCFIFHIAFVCISTGLHSLPGLFSLPLSLALHTILYFACFSTGIHSLYSLFGLSLYLYTICIRMYLSSR